MQSHIPEHGRGKALCFQTWWPHGAPLWFSHRSQLFLYVSPCVARAGRHRVEVVSSPLAGLQGLVGYHSSVASLGLVTGSMPLCFKSLRRLQHSGAGRWGGEPRALICNQVLKGLSRPSCIVGAARPLCAGILFHTKRDSLLPETYQPPESVPWTAIGSTTQPCMCWFHASF